MSISNCADNLLITCCLIKNTTHEYKCKYASKLYPTVLLFFLEVVDPLSEEKAAKEINEKAESFPEPWKAAFQICSLLKAPQKALYY